MNLQKDLKTLLKDKIFLAFLGLIVLIYFAVRFINLDIIPVFVDEAIYIRWSQVMRAEPTLRFLPQSDGKQPLFMWLTIPFLKVFADPLIAGRATSIFAGLLTLLGVGTLTYIITKSKRSTVLAAFLYVLVPYTHFFDRLALVDSLLAAFGIWSIILGFLYVKNPRLDLSMILGFVLGGALLTKSPGLFFILLQPLFLLTLDKRPKQKELVKIILGWALSGFIALLAFNILRLGPNFHLITSRNQDYVFSFGEVLTHPFNPLIGNLKSTLRWYLSFLSWPVFATAILALFLKHHYKKVVPLGLWIILPLILQASIAKVYTARYILYTVPPLLVLVSLFLSTTLRKIRKGAALALIAIIFIIPSLKTYRLYRQPSRVNIPQNEKHGYFQEWTAGYGQKEVAQYLLERSKEVTVVVGTEGYFGTLPDGLQIYTEGNPRVTIFGIGQPVGQIPDSLRNSLAEHEVYLVLNQSRNRLKPIDLENNLELIAEYPKPARPDGTNEALQLYRLIK